ncbi:MAG TPA: hypothetical protein VEL76_06005 [Gemmataceae bacterium]|nr:hypothetical protein [Gemmataceae bacterium]
MASLHEVAHAVFPRLTPDNYRLSSPPSRDYNCIGWAAGETDEWWWPDGVWPAGVPKEETLAAFFAAFATLGYIPCASADQEIGVEKVALYAVGDIPTHAARQLSSGQWTSKLGLNVDIEHTTPEVIAGGVYGEVVAILARKVAAEPPSAAR